MARTLASFEEFFVSATTDGLGIVDYTSVSLDIPAEFCATMDPGTKPASRRLVAMSFDDDTKEGDLMEFSESSASAGASSKRALLNLSNDPSWFDMNVINHAPRLRWRVQ